VGDRLRSVLQVLRFNRLGLLVAGVVVATVAIAVGVVLFVQALLVAAPSAPVLPLGAVELRCDPPAPCEMVDTPVVQVLESPVLNLAVLGDVAAVSVVAVSGESLAAVLSAGGKLDLTGLLPGRYEVLVTLTSGKSFALTVQR
jgi:hypothetical protein